MTKAQKKYALGKQLKELGFEKIALDGEIYFEKEYHSASICIGDEGVSVDVFDAKMSIGSIALLDSILKNPDATPSKA